MTQLNPVIYDYEDQDQSGILVPETGQGKGEQAPMSYKSGLSYEIKYAKDGELTSVDPLTTIGVLTMSRLGYNDEKSHSDVVDQLVFDEFGDVYIRSGENATWGIYKRLLNSARPVTAEYLTFTGGTDAVYDTTTAVTLAYPYAWALSEIQPMPVLGNGLKVEAIGEEGSEVDSLSLDIEDYATTLDISLKSDKNILLTSEGITIESISEDAEYNNVIKFAGTESVIGEVVSAEFGNTLMISSNENNIAILTGGNKIYTDGVILPQLTDVDTIGTDEFFYNNVYSTELTTTKLNIYDSDEEAAEAEEAEEYILSVNKGELLFNETPVIASLATYDKPGVVKVGKGLIVSDDGTININYSVEDIIFDCFINSNETTVSAELGPYAFIDIKGTIFGVVPNSSNLYKSANKGGTFSIITIPAAGGYHAGKSLQSGYDNFLYTIYNTNLRIFNVTDNSMYNNVTLPGSCRRFLIVDKYNSIFVALSTGSEIYKYDLSGNNMTTVYSTTFGNTSLGTVRAAYYNEKDDVIVFCGYTYVGYSRDGGVTWNIVAHGIASCLCMDYSPKLDTYIFSSTSSAKISKDLQTFTPVETPTGTRYEMHWIPELGAFVYASSASISMSHDGVEWKQNTGFPHGTVYDVMYVPSNRTLLIGCSSPKGIHKVKSI
jgi:hypothetical protein